MKRLWTRVSLLFPIPFLDWAMSSWALSRVSGRLGVELSGYMLSSGHLWHYCVTVVPAAPELLWSTWSMLWVPIFSTLRTARSSFPEAMGGQSSCLSWNCTLARLTRQHQLTTPAAFSHHLQTLAYTHAIYRPQFQLTGNFFFFLKFIFKILILSSGEELQF